MIWPRTNPCFQRHRSARPDGYRLFGTPLYKYSTVACLFVCEQVDKANDLNGFSQPNQTQPQPAYYVVPPRQSDSTNLLKLLKSSRAFFSLILIKFSLRKRSITTWNLHISCNSNKVFKIEAGFRTRWWEKHYAQANVMNGKLQLSTRSAQTWSKMVKILLKDHSV